MSDTRRPMPPAGSTSADPATDPRHALAEQYLQRAAAELAEEEAAKPRARRRPAAGRAALASGFSVAVAPVTFLHIALVALALTFDALAITLLYHMLHVNFVVARVLALPVGILSAAIWAYLSVCYLGVIESTSSGETNVDSLQGDWQEWFWTLPMSLGMLAASAGFGWLLSFVLAINIWWLIAWSILLTYPILQLSALETGSPLTPLSLPVLGSLTRHPLAWLAVYAISFAMTGALWLLLQAAWNDPPYSTMLVMGPAVTVALFVYAWLLGQLASMIASDQNTENE